MPTRVVVLDTETTGFSPQWHRVVEFAAVEVEPRTGLTANELHYVINPLKPIPPAVTAIHGLRDEDVRDKPPFAALAPEIAAFLRGAVLAIQNAAFDVSMLDAELERANQSPLGDLGVTIVDILDVSRNVFPLLRRHDLDSICDHVGVSRKERTTHGALLDVKLLVATLPKFASEYDVWRAAVEHGCTAELDQFEQELKNFVDQLISSIDNSSAETIDRSISRLAAADRWISATTKWFDSVVKVLLDKENNWSCKHFSARWDASVSTSWKGMATENLSPDDLKKYQTEAVSRTHTPKPDGAVTETLAVFQSLFDQPAVTNSIACALRGLVALRVADKKIDAERSSLREKLLQNVDAGYTIQHGTLREGVRTNTNYKQAVTDLCPDASSASHETEQVTLKVGARNSEACEVLFG